MAIRKEGNTSISLTVNTFGPSLELSTGYMTLRKQKIPIFPTMLSEKKKTHILAIDHHQLFYRLSGILKLSILIVSEVLSHAIYQFHIVRHPVPQSELREKIMAEKNFRVVN